jgi:hypothetical protein
MIIVNDPGAITANVMYLFYYLLLGKVFSSTFPVLELILPYYLYKTFFKHDLAQTVSRMFLFLKY